ncbi:uncharacterized protein DUF262 [Tissierella praeacuta]|uniref:DUF262 domain-containing protein n=1 Tax=Tissierella praeacuta TaxID=43131 RepID=UPI00104E4729|nr:DUF262 domain-containing protein [Tissierella praeacuta]TCU65641.1 uncharacterized protein DUF262 [Tissierella praeacuta]
MSLQDEITAKSSQIFRDSYQMSIGELINLYRDGEMDIHPEFQRVFRWNDYQKTKLIESIMLNIPIPPIFVSQDDDGIWDVIDGVQRLSTIFQFVGILRDENNNDVEPLVLLGTDYLPSFEGMKWGSEDEVKGFTREQQLNFKRSRLDVTIVKKESDPNTKYELFQRLNTGGSLLSDQEVRNCLMIMSNKEFYEFLDSLQKYDNFRNTISISDRKSDEEYRMELLLRLLVAVEIDWNIVNDYRAFSELLDKEVLKLCKNKQYDKISAKDRFCKTFDIIYDILGEDAFKRFSGNKHVGPFLNASYQAISYGVYNNIDDILKQNNYKVWLSNKIKEMYDNEDFTKNMVPGVRAIPRYKDLSNFGVNYFRP